MKCSLFFLTLLLSATLCAQNDGHVMMKNCSTLCFTPNQYSASGDAVMHIMQDDAVGVYDNEISLVKNIDIPVLKFGYLSSSRRTRTVEQVVRTAVVRGELLTEIYTAYATKDGKDFAQLTYNEQRRVILDYETSIYNADIETREEDDCTLFFVREGNYSSFFNYHTYGFAYPKVGILLDKNGRVYRFNAKYSYKYSAWSDYEIGHDTIVGEKNVLSCVSINTQGDMSGSRYYITSTLFNDDEELEYIRPSYTLVDAPVYDIVGGDEESDLPVLSEGEYFNKELAIKGLEIVSESGTIIGSIDFGTHYSNIGIFTLIGGSVIYMGYDIQMLQLGGNRYLSFDTYADEMGSIAIYKHFYKIDAETNSIEAVNAPVRIKVLQTTPRGVEVECDLGSDADVELFTPSGQRCAVEKMNAGKCVIDVDHSGTYLVGVRKKGVLLGSKKIMVK